MTTYIVYRTTNLVNGKYYIGKHKCQSPNDGYLGSGTLLKQAIKKHGRGSFRREILHQCDTEEQAYQLEQQIVTESLMNDPQCYNMRTGGDGGFTRTLPPGTHDGANNPMYGRQHSEETKELIRQKALGRKHSEETKRLLGDLSRGHVKTEAERAKRRAALKKYAQNRSPEHNAKLAAANRARAHIKRKWYHDGTEERLFEVAKPIPEGWTAGRLR